MSGRGHVREEGGQVIVLFATALPIFLVLLLLVIDGGRMLVERERLRNAAHFAAEAAVSLAGDRDDRLPTDAEARQMVDTALRLNLPGLLSARAESVITSGRLGVSPYQVRVRVTEQFSTSIQRLSFTIAAEAAAQLGQTSAPPPAQAAAGQPNVSSGAGQAAAPAPAAEICGRASVAGGAITVPGEIGKLTGQGGYSWAGATARAGARCQAELYLGDGGAAATYAVEVTAAGDRDLWIRAHDDGLHRAGIRSVTIVVNGQSARWADEGKNVGWKWYPIGRFRLGQGQADVKITKVAGTSAAFIMDEFVLSSDLGSAPR